MQEDLSVLLKIQDLDVKIRESERKRVEKPEYVAGLKDDFASKQNNLENLKEQIKHLESEKKNLELDFESKEASAIKYQGQQAVVKTNAEYKALENEIKNIKSESRHVEDKIIETMEKIEDVRKKIFQEEEFLKREKDKLIIEEQKVKDELAMDERELVAVRKEREDLLAKVNGSVLDKYNLIFENKDDMAIVPVEHGSCGGCFMKITAQIINELKRSEEIITCENCARMLYLKLDS